jgi:two-component system sensor histidine kinase MtrB
MSRGSFRRRVAVAIAVSVGAATLLLAVGVWTTVRTALRAELVDRAVERTQFDVGVLAVARLGNQVRLSDFEDGSLASEFLLRGSDGLYVETVDGPYASGFLFARPPSPALAGAVAAGWVAYEWVELSGRPYLMVGARRPPSGPDMYFFYDAQPIGATLSRLVAVLAGGWAGVVGLAWVAADRVAQRVLKPVAAASRAANRMAKGERGVRIRQQGDDELAEWAAAFNRMAETLESQIDQLRQAEQRQRHFVSDVSHELRTPVTALVNEATLLSRHLDHMPPEAARVAGLVTRDVGRLRELVDDLLELSRLDAGEAVRLEPTRLGRFASTLIDRRPGEPIELEVDDVEVMIDRNCLERIVGNLVDNAVEHGRPPVTVRMEVAGGELIVEVADSGAGVPPEDRARMFERFWKGDPSRSRGGSGLGLAIAKEHARRLGGDLEATTLPSGRFAVRARIPVTQPLPDREVPDTRDFDDGGSREKGK